MQHVPDQLGKQSDSGKGHMQANSLELVDLTIMGK